jgi:hypothetical protein
MTEKLPSSRSLHCQADHDCHRAPCFQARLAASAGRRRVRRRTVLCAHHLGGTVQALTTWARGRGLEGKVTVLVIEQAAAGQADRNGKIRCGFAFGTIPLIP